ncbi:MAG: LON peptidase substrate-binding domain-containing protein [Opitutaceae bacterium]
METLHVPATLPVMTLPDTVFFPQALLPLHIFEPRYREMLRDVLAHDRLFAIARLNPQGQKKIGQPEPLHQIASVGIIRACQKADDGTSNLLLQGLCRVRIEAIVAEEPYRRIRVRALASQPGANAEKINRLQRELARLLGLREKLAAQGASEMTSFLKTVEDPEAFVDLAAFSLCEDLRVKQTLLETLDLSRRLELFSAQVRDEIAGLKLRHRLQGRLPDDRISNN